jgi:hypothetical protein
VLAQMNESTAKAFSRTHTIECWSTLVHAFADYFKRIYNTKMLESGD